MNKAEEERAVCLANSLNGNAFQYNFGNFTEDKILTEEISSFQKKKIAVLEKLPTRKAEAEVSKTVVNFVFHCGSIE